MFVHLCCRKKKRIHASITNWAGSGLERMAEAAMMRSVFPLETWSNTAEACSISHPFSQPRCCEQDSEQADQLHSQGSSGQFEEIAFHSRCSSKANLLFSLCRRSQKEKKIAAKLETAGLLRGTERRRVCVGVQMSDSDRSWPQQAWSRSKCPSPTTDVDTATDGRDKIDEVAQMEPLLRADAGSGCSYHFNIKLENSLEL